MEKRYGNSSIKWIIILAVLFVLSLFTSLYVEWLWFGSINFKNVFSIILLNKIALYASVFIFSFLLFLLNLELTRKHLGPRDQRPDENEEGREIIYLNEEKSPWKAFLQGKTARWIFLGASIIGALMVSSAVSDNWITVQQFINRVQVGTVDPIFNKDIGFYFFNLTFYRFIYSTLMLTLVLVTMFTGAIYAINASSNIIFGDWKHFTFAKSHLAVLVAAIFVLKAWGYRLSSFDILFSPVGIVYGATYSDIYGRLLSYKVLLVISLIAAAVILVNIFIKKLNWILISIGAWLVVAVLLNGIYPTVLQKLVVQPNEFNKEKPYIENAIKFTRQAYALNRVKNEKFDIDYELDINNAGNQTTINNIRLWDWQPLRVTYKNLQELRPYYAFNDVDIDRYVVDGQYRQLMLSAREIDQEELPSQAKTWINQRLMYTHGYGVVASPVNEVAQEGFPRFFIKDIPPRVSTDLTVTRPEIYFGEKTNSYVIVNTEQEEFDYPMGESNVYTNYEGNKGIKINSFLNRLIFSWVLKDYKMILSSDITNESQILMNRNIMERTKKIAPYLIFDSDPYIVVNGDNGKLYWILDAYTVSSRYPYSEPFDQDGNNYLRNSVKVTCDAYTGELNFYIADSSDPIIKTYDKIFPGLYQPLSKMPAGLKAHIRYPVDMFSVQASMYRTFHMTDPNVFYNQEDPWLVPNEIVNNDQQKMEPYYIIMRLPGEEKAEYILMLPFTPKSRLNMIGWMCARMDGDNYGNMLVFSFPKQETIYGPQQIESRINQDTEISQKLSLWNQQGSSVYRGNLLVIPMNNSILYVEPLYLQADNSKLPELKRVIAGFGNKIVMESSLDKALTSLFGERRDVTPDKGDDTGVTTDDEINGNSVEELAKQARQYYDRANQLLKDGDWAGYGENIKKLNDVIKELETVLAE